MKKTMILIALTLMIGVLIYACRKEGTQQPGQPGVSGGSSNLSARPSGVKTYYSKNNFGVVYKMVLNVVNGQVSIDRSLYQTTRPDTIKKGLVIEDFAVDGAHLDASGQMVADTGRIHVGDRKLLYIPFEPGQDPLNPENGGGGTSDIMVYCIPLCTATNEVCNLACGNKMWWCWGDCEACMLVISGPMFVVFDIAIPLKPMEHGGAVILEADGFNVIN